MSTTPFSNGVCQQRQRNYGDEYQRRIASGKARGLTRSQAAGHPRRGEISAWEKFWADYYVDAARCFVHEAAHDLWRWSHYDPDLVIRAHLLAQFWNWTPHGDVPKNQQLSMEHWLNTLLRRSKSAPMHPDSGNWWRILVMEPPDGEA